MPRPTIFRCLAGLLALAMLLTGLTAPAALASVAPTSVVTVDGFLTTVSSAHPDLLVVNYTVTVQGTSLTDAQLTTKTFSSDPVDPSTVQVNGTTVPSTTVTRTATKMTVRLGTGADATNGGTLGVGSYLVSYQQQRPAGSSPSTLGQLTFDRSGTPGSASSNAVALSHPDLSLTIPAGLGEDKAAYLGTGRPAEFAAYLRNRGAPTDSAVLTVTLPDGLRVDSSEGGVVLVDLGSEDGGFGTQPKCTGTLTATVTCNLGPIDHGSVNGLIVPVIATSKAKPGTSGVFHLNVAPAGEPDQDKSNNTLAGRVRFTGIAHLKVTLTAKQTKIQVGKTVHVKLRIHNLGPQPAGFTFSILITGSKHFVVSKFMTKRHPKTGPRWMRLPVPASLGSALVWNAGLIAVHHTAYAVLILKAKSAGKAIVRTAGSSAAGDPGCDTGESKCQAVASLTLHAVKHAAATKSAAVKHD